MRVSLSEVFREKKVCGVGFDGCYCAKKIVPGYTVPEKVLERVLETIVVKYRRARY